VQSERLATDVAAYVGEFGDPFDERDPTTLTISAHYPDAASLDPMLKAIDEELARIADDGLEPGELDRVRTRLVAVLVRGLDPVMSRTLEFGKFELVHGRAELATELPGRLAAVPESAVRRAAGALQPQRRAVLELIAGGTR
jgi:predicted Zn-dependent peptidase